MRLRFFALGLAAILIAPACADDEPIPADAGDPVVTDASGPDSVSDAAKADASTADGPRDSNVVDVARSYTVGGNISGLVGTGLVLHDPALGDLPITMNGPFSFPAAVASGTGYKLAVGTTPSSPDQSCTITNGTGTVANGDITDIAIACVVTPACNDTATIPATNTRDIDSYGTSLFFMSEAGYGALNVYDVSNPTAPVAQGNLVLTAQTGCWYAGSVRVAPGGNYAYVYGGGCYGLPVIDITDRAHPVAVSIIPGPTDGGSMDLNICGNMAYVAIQEKGIAAYDISNPAAPVYQGESVIAGAPYPYGISCWINDATTDSVYLGDGGSSGISGLRIYDYNKSTHTFTPRGTYTPSTTSWGARGWPLSKSRLFMSWSNTSQLALFDVSNEDTIPAPLTFDDAGDSNTALLVNGTHLFTYHRGGLGVFDISTPTAPSLIYTKDLGNTEPIGLTRFTATGEPYLGITTNGGTALSLCHLVHL